MELFSIFVKYCISSYGRASIKIIPILLLIPMLFGSLLMLNHIVSKQFILSRQIKRYIDLRRYYNIFVLVLLVLGIGFFIQQKHEYSVKYNNSVADLHDIYESTKKINADNFIEKF